MADRLAVGAERWKTDEVEIENAVGLRDEIRRLAAHHGDVVVEAQVPDAVVLPEQLPLRTKDRIEVGRRRSGSEGLLEAFVFEDDDEDVTDVGRAGGVHLLRARSEQDGEQRRDHHQSSHRLPPASM